MAANQPRNITFEETEILSFIRQNIIQKICQEATRQGRARNDPQVIQAICAHFNLGPTPHRVFQALVHRLANSFWGEFGSLLHVTPQPATCDHQPKHILPHPTFRVGERHPANCSALTALLFSFREDNCHGLSEIVKQVVTSTLHFFHDAMWLRKKAGHLIIWANASWAGCWRHHSDSLVWLAVVSRMLILIPSRLLQNRKTRIPRPWRSSCVASTGSTVKTQDFSNKKAAPRNRAVLPTTNVLWCPPVSIVLPSGPSLADKNAHTHTHTHTHTRARARAHTNSEKIIIIDAQPFVCVLCSLDKKFSQTQNNCCSNAWDEVVSCPLHWSATQKINPKTTQNHTMTNVSKRK